MILFRYFLLTLIRSVTIPRRIVLKPMLTRIDERIKDWM
jgi:hypothetical protein